jgi:PAS domain S-box-containing protein
MSVVTHPGRAGEPEVGRLRTLYQLLASLSRARALEDVYSAALTSLLAGTSADRAGILLFDDDGVMRFKASRGLSGEYQAAVTGHSPWRRGTLDSEPLCVPDVLLDESLKQFWPLMQREGVRGLIFVPLALEAGVFGKLVLYYAEPHESAADELELAQAIATHVAWATQSKRAEMACIASEQRLQAILDNSPAVIFLKDLQGRHLLVNRRFEELFHITSEKALGRTDHDLFPAEIADRFQANDRAVVAAGKPLEIEEYAPHDDGVHTYLSMKFPLTAPDGTVSGVCGIATDITERKQLDTASQYLASIVESSNDAIIGKDLNGIVTSWNKGAQRIFGYTAAEMIGKPIATLAPQDHLDEMPEILSKLRQGLRVEHYETRRRRKDGEIIHVALTVSPLRDSNGRIIGASKIARDITDRKQAERERLLLLAREQEARRTAELLNRVGPRLVAQLDLEKLAQEIIDIAAALVGAEFGAFLHNAFDEKGESRLIYTFAGGERQSFAGIPASRTSDLQGPTFGGQSVVRSEDVTEDPRYLKNRPPVPLGDRPLRSYLAAALIARSGETLGSLFFGHSQPGKFTETHEAIIAGIAAQAAIAVDNARLFEQSQWAQTELTRSNEELRRANRDLEVFAYSASHDLQEPLRTIAISSQLLDRSVGPQLSGDNARFLAHILTAAHRMRVLIEDLLAYTKATKYEEGPPPRVDSAKVLTEVLESMRGSTEQAQATVTAGELPAVAIHESRLAQLFQNLVGNAIKYRGKEAPRVHVSAEERNGWYVFSVTDNGIGVEPQYGEQIFSLFKRLHGQDQYPGSGIGLAICQRIVEQYGGRIWLDHSAPGGGSTFCFSIPTRT